MTEKTLHFDALRAYLNLLEKNIARRGDVSRKEHFARMLIAKLQDEDVNPVSYRVAVNSLLDALPTEYKGDAVSVAREFFPFLVSDIKSVAAMMQSGSYRGFSAGNGVIGDSDIKCIEGLIDQSAGQALTARQSALHGKYLACLAKLGLEEGVMAIRGKMSRLLLNLTCNQVVTHVLYRTALDGILPKLSSEKTRQYFLLVAREFYYFLTEDPNAPAMVNVMDSE